MSRFPHPLRTLSSALFAILATMIAVPDALPGQTVDQLLVHSRDHDPLVALSVRFPNGAASDPADQSGAAFLLGRVVEEEGNPRIAELSARLSVDVARNEFTLTLLAPPDRWIEAWERMRPLLESSPLSESVVADARTRHGERLLFEAGAPGRNFEVEEAAYLYGASTPEARPIAGTREGIEGLERSDLEAARARVIRWEEAIAALVGPIDENDAGVVFSGPTLQVGPPPPVAPPTAPAEDAADTTGADSLGAAPPVIPPGAADAPAVRIGRRSPVLQAPSGAQEGTAPWNSRDRRTIDRDVTSTWITVAWPLPSGAPLVLEDFLVHLIEEALNPTPPDPGVYWAEVEIRSVRGTPVLVVNASVDPGSALEWEERILDEVEQVATDPPRGAFFELARRRYRSARLLGHAVPEDRARWIARTWARHGEIPRIPAEVWGLERGQVSALAEARGEPRILLFGPMNLMVP